MQKHRSWLWLLALLAFALVAAACGGDDAGSEGDSTTTAAATPEETTATTQAPDTTAGPDTTAAPEMDPALAGLASCPNPISFQTDWFPEPEHGALYNLTAGEGSIDPGTGVFTGPLAADPMYDVEIRAGGPYIGFQPTVSLMSTDDSIFLGYVNTDEAIQFYEDTPTIAVFAPLEINPQIIMWDPATYDISSWDDVKGTGAIIRHFAGATYTEFLVGAGLVDAAQLDGTYDGSPSVFIAENGAIIQQGFATQEPYNYENVFADWGKPVDFLLIHDAGFEIYQGAVSIRADKFDDAAKDCLSALVPLLQQSAVDFQNDPGPTNAAILQAVTDLASFWELSEDSVANTVEQMDALGIVSNGSNGTIGDFDPARIQGVFDVIAAQVPSIVIPDGLTPEDIYTNEFIDESIGR
jgi:hypothetical protein